MRGPARVVEGARAALAVPYPAKTRILEELASDAEALYAHFREVGHGHASALHEVELRLGVTLSAAAELEELHRPLYARLVERYAPGRETMVEWGLLVVTVIALLGSWGSAMVRLNLMSGGSVLPWVVLVAGAGAWLAAFTKAFHVGVRGEVLLPRLRSGLGSMLALAGTSLAAAVLSGFVELYRAAARAVASPGEAMRVMMPWLRQSADLLVAALATAIGVGIVWFLLETRIRALERVERELDPGSLRVVRQQTEGGGK